MYSQRKVAWWKKTRTGKVGEGEFHGRLQNVVFAEKVWWCKEENKHDSFDD